LTSADLVFSGTRWESRRATTGIRWRYGWEELARRITTPPELHHLKVDMPLWCLATFESDIRKLTAVEGISGLLLVYEPEAGLNAEMVRSVWGNHCMMAYTGISDQPDQNRWIVILPLARRVDAPAYRRLMEWASERLSGLSPNCRVPVFSVPLPARAPGYQSLCEANRAVLDPDKVLALLSGSSEHGALATLPQALGARLAEVVGHMERRAADSERPISVPWPSLTEAIGGGLWPGLHLLWGTGDSGKSALALAFGLHAARLGQPVMYYAPFDSETSLVARLIGQEIESPWAPLALGRDPVAVHEVRHRVDALLGRIPFHIHSAQDGLPYTTGIYQAVQGLREQHPGGPILVVLDPPVFMSRKGLVRPMSPELFQMLARLRGLGERLDIAFLLVVGSGSASTQEPPVPPFLGTISSTVLHLLPAPPLSKDTGRLGRLIVEKSQLGRSRWEMHLQDPGWGWRALE
jgi:hypothetical protein